MCNVLDNSNVVWSVHWTWVALYNRISAAIRFDKYTSRQLLFFIRTYLFLNCVILFNHPTRETCQNHASSVCPGTEDWLKIILLLGSSPVAKNSL